MIRMIAGIVLSIPVIVVPVWAQETTAAGDPAGWSSQIELGAVVTTGNTEQENLKFAVEMSNDGIILKHTGHIDGIRASENDVVTAEKYYAFYQADYKLKDDHSVFGRVAWERDEFSGFDYQVDSTVGYSRLLIMSETLEWRGDAGVGVRHSEFATGARQSEFITRLATHFSWQVSETARFRQDVSVEMGDQSTITRSETSLRTNVVGNLAMKVAVNVKHQSDVPPGREKTDTESSITLVYSF
jgi:putative salt-induced outer membrane protein